jgi:hypothetical protein
MLENLGEPQSKSVCKLVMKMRELDESDQKILEDALADPAWGNSLLTRRLNELGFTVYRDTLTRHRNKECACVRQS